MIAYLRMKKNEWKIKGAFYGIIASFIDGKEEMRGLLQKMYISLKDVPAEELREELISRLAEIIHEGNKDRGK